MFASYQIRATLSNVIAKTQQDWRSCFRPKHQTFTTSATASASNGRPNSQQRALTLCGGVKSNKEVQSRVPLAGPWAQR